MAASNINPVSNFKSQYAVPDFESLPERYEWAQENENGYRIREQLCGTERPLRVIHVGCGAAGICLSKFLPEELNNVSLTCYDKNHDIGGTWLENRYPGCACDIPSVNYQFTFAKNPSWTHFYSFAPEIWQYMRDIVDRFGLRKYMKLKHEVIGAYWRQEEAHWEVHVKDLLNNTTIIDYADIFINGSGLLNDWKWPEIKGLHDFKGQLCHTATWRDDIQYKGKRVAVIGTGSSGIQLTANIAEHTEKLYTWIRSPTWITAGFAQQFAGPNGANFQYTVEQKKRFREHPKEYVTYCKQIENELNQRFKFILTNTPEAEQARQFSAAQMKERLSGDKALIDAIIPKDFAVGCRRPTPGNGFLEALALPQTHVFTKEMQTVTEKGFIDAEGVEHEVDLIVCASGFNTSWRSRFPIIAHGKNVQDHFIGKPKSYFGIAIPGFPNYFTGIGPYGPLGHGSFLPVLELVYYYFIQVIRKFQRENIKSLQPREEVMDKFVEHADLFMKRTAWAGPCRSWFKQGKTDGTATIFPGTRLVFFDVLSSPRFEDYEIEYQSGNPFNWLGNGFALCEYNGGDISYYLGNTENPGGMLPLPEDALKIGPAKNPVVASVVPLSEETVI
ncbi:hypothetical protein LTR84_009136 [Exophiala bonariae]|uniref:L-ornithine N(5)-oxygenase n=1 Tax=Exophiala bonariae TaxID=1690606 RepID=A0AAV9MV39_9EURO|nr:hypothetical protein LTR84_009136 [Exophiala bonariae]